MTLLSPDKELSTGSLLTLARSYSQDPPLPGQELLPGPSSQWPGVIDRSLHFWPGVTVRTLLSPDKELSTGSLLTLARSYNQDPSHPGASLTG
jgi:hypothetical protein